MQIPLREVGDLPRIDGQQITLDTETDGLNKMVNKPILVQLKIGDEAFGLRPGNSTISWLNDNLPKSSLNIFHNAKFDLHMLIQAGLDDHTVDNSKIWCTMIAETLLDEHRGSYTLERLCREKVGMRKSDAGLYEWLAEHTGGKPTRKAQIGKLALAPIEMVNYYGIGDVDMTQALYEHHIREMHDQQLMDVMNLEMDVLKALVRIERRGAPINMDHAHESKAYFEDRQQQVYQEMCEMVGFEVNVRSGPQMLKAFTKLKIPVTYKKKTGNPTFAVDVISEIEHPFPKLVLELRSIGTMINTFLNKFDDHVHTDGRIHCDFNQTRNHNYGTVTGRLSASNPNLQQIPKRKQQQAKYVRSLFEVPDKHNQSWISADWSQFEFRVFGHYANDEALIDSFINDPDLDFHQATADLTGLKRNPFAKQLNLGLVFGMGMGKMAMKCGLPYKQEFKHGKVMFSAGSEAKRIFNKYHKKLPGVRKMLKLAEARAKQRGYVKTIKGRRLRFPNPNTAYKAGGLIFQGTSADLMKAKMVQLEREFRATDCELILSVHDEFDLICDKADVDKHSKRIKEIMEDMPNLRLPIRVDIGMAENWYEASK
jgi:DNA polymerase-1